MSLAAVKNYLDIEEQSIGKIVGGILGLVGRFLYRSRNNLLSICSKYDKCMLMLEISNSL